LRANVLAATSRTDSIPNGYTADAGPERSDGVRFHEAETELSRGQKAEARAHLVPLMKSRDVSLAGDAAFLYAQSFESPRDRGDALAQYLATEPPSPYYEQALVERAQALLDWGDTKGASLLVAELRDREVPDVIRPSLARLEAKLGRASKE
jgi:hypothetical protein